MNYQSYKDRQINFNIPVQVYKNLHNGMLSIKQNGLVVAHVQNIILYDANCKVSDSGRERVLQSKSKNVHAFITGYVKHININNASDLINKLQCIQHSKFSYNPYKFNFFYMLSNNTPAIFKSSDLILVDSKQGCFVLDAIQCN